MILTLADIKRNVIAPIVLDLELTGDEFARVQLMAGIGNVETGYHTRYQVDGPALGFWQVEPRTHDDLWQNWLCARPALAEVTRSYLPTQFDDRPSADALAISDRYAACIATLVFYRSPIPLPPRGNARAQCAAWKAGYNTAAGAGRIDPQHIALFQEAINT